MFTAWCSQIEGCWVPSVHADCNHNEVSALLKRSLAPTPQPTNLAGSLCYTGFESLDRLLNGSAVQDGVTWKRRNLTVVLCVVDTLMQRSLLT
jgi:hypothetical protein